MFVSDVDYCEDSHYVSGVLEHNFMFWSRISLTKFSMKDVPSNTGTGKLLITSITNRTRTSPNQTCYKTVTKIMTFWFVALRNKCIRWLESFEPLYLLEVFSSKIRIYPCAENTFYRVLLVR